MEPLDSTRVISTRLNSALIQKLESLSKQDQRSVANTVALLIVRALPEYEREVLGRAAPAERAEEVAP